MAKINNQPPKQPLWPWGGPRGVRERLVDPTQLEGRQKKRKVGDPKNPALPSAELLDSIGYPHGADELRLPAPLPPPGHDADLAGFMDGPNLARVAERFAPETLRGLERFLARVQTSPERQERLRALLEREQSMLELVGTLASEIADIRRKMKEEQQEDGY